MDESAGTMEEQWIIEAQGGSAAAFGHLVALYQGKLYGFLLSYVGRGDVADELTQEAFLKAWRGLKGFRSESRFQTWLFQIGLNVLRSWGRREKIRRLRERAFGWVREDDEAPRAPEERLKDPRLDAEPHRAADAVDLREKTNGAVAQLPPKEKMVFLLRHEQGLPLADIARAMDVAEGTVKAHLFHALAKLRKRLEEHI
jgi:RNA polymerase sigma-70 factor (ECF subfamily)